MTRSDQSDAAVPSMLCRRAEDAGLNASAPPQQRWIDGWLVRFSPGKAQRARCIQAVADGGLPLSQRLSLCTDVYRDAGLPMLARITPFSRPVDLDDQLVGLGWHRYDETLVLVKPTLSDALPPQPSGTRLAVVDGEAYAEIVGALRGSSRIERQAHAQRLALSPVPYQGWVLRRADGDGVLACAQLASESDIAGLYDVFTDPGARGRGLASWLCQHLLVGAHARGVRTAYLQVGAENAAAISVYRRLGFVDGYSYHYRAAPLAGD